MVLYAFRVERGLSALITVRGIAMSRFHSVRPKKHKHEHRQVPQPAAPAQSIPTEAQQEEFARAKLKQMADEVYRERNGLELDASIARWKRMLELYDREMEAVSKEDGSKQHRWTVSPSIAFRADERLGKLLSLREKLKAECIQEAREIMQHFMQHYNPETGSLCPPKYPESASEAAAQHGPAHTQPEETADAGPIGHAAA
jgi:hypothetical protein